MSMFTVSGFLNFAGDIRLVREKKFLSKGVDMQITFVLKFLNPLLL